MMTSTPSLPEQDFAAFVAFDWADREHAWSLQVASTGQREHGTLVHTPAAIEAWAQQLAARFPGRCVAVALEQSRGALIFALRLFPHLVLFPIHPTTSYNYRAAMSPSGSKDDPKDADLLLDLLVHHRDRLRVLPPEDEPTRKLQMLVEKRRQLVDDKTAQKNRITDLLKLYFPQVLDWFDDLDAPIVAAFLQRWPTLEKLQDTDPEVVRTFFYEHHSRSASKIEKRLQQMRQARAALVDAAVREPAQILVQALFRVVMALREGITHLEKAIAQTAGAHPDYPLFMSFPGAGAVMATRLLAAFGTQRDRFASVHELQAFSGIAPVISRSGESQCWIHFRWACPKFLRQTFHEFAALSIPHCAWAKDFYEKKRREKKAHNAAIRALAFKWIRILFRCWKSGTPYDDSIFTLARIQRHLDQNSQAGSPPSKAASKTTPPQSSFLSGFGCGGTVNYQFKNFAGMFKFSGFTS
jgi:transposase